MTYKILGDSCTDITESLRNDEHIGIVSLSIEVGNDHFIDDETFDQADFLDKMKKCATAPTSACPAPEAYMEHFEDADDIYVVTLSSKLSGSYNSAMVAKNMYLEDHPDKNIEIIDSLSASVGQSLILLKIKELADKGLPFKEIVSEVLAYRDNMRTKFVLESLDNLQKNGRLSGLKAIICNTLNIKPIMKSDGQGSIVKEDQARGMKRALENLAKNVKTDAIEPEEKTLGIAHCNNYDRACFVRDEILKHVSFKDVFIVNTAGISSLYANDGGIVVCY